MKKPTAKKPPTQSSGAQTTHISVQSHKWEAPLPPPAVLDEFNAVVPNGAERIVRAWELESQHRRDIEKSEQKSWYRDLLVGKICALIFVLTALGVSGWAAANGAEWFGAILGAGTIGSVVWAFVQGRKEKK